MTIQPTLRLIKVEEYHKMAEVGVLTGTDYVELIEGQILEMSPIGSRHAACVNKIVKLLNQLLGDQAIVSGQNPVRLNDYSEPQPDLAVLKPAADFYADKHPGPSDILLLIEVADTSFEYDREVKIPLYAKAGIPACWIINLNKNELEAYGEPIGDAYKTRTIIRKGDQVDFPAFGLTVVADDLLI